MLAFATIAVSCENCEQTCESQAKPRPNLGTHHKSPLGVSSLSERARWRRRPYNFVPGACRAVPSECRANPQGPGVLRRVRRARRGLLRPRPETPSPQILGLDQKLRVAIMGAGNLGLALADYPGFRMEGFEIAALFDNRNEKVGQQSR